MRYRASVNLLPLVIKVVIELWAYVPILHNPESVCSLLLLGSIEAALATDVRWGNVSLGEIGAMEANEELLKIKSDLTCSLLCTYSTGPTHGP